MFLLFDNLTYKINILKNYFDKNLDDNFTSVPIMMMTTENKPAYIKEALSLGASEYIMKPFTSDILFNKIDLVCGGF